MLIEAILRALVSGASKYMGYYANGRNQVIVGTGEPIVVTIPKLLQQWIGMDGVEADNNAYHFQVSLYPSFSGTIFDAIQRSSQYTGSSFVVAEGVEIVNRGNIYFFPFGIADLEENTKTSYYWRVRTGVVLITDEYEWNDWSTKWQFQVNKPPTSPEILSINGLVE